MTMAPPSFPLHVPPPPPGAPSAGTCLAPAAEKEEGMDRSRRMRALPKSGVVLVKCSPAPWGEHTCLLRVRCLLVGCSGSAACRGYQAVP